MSRKVATRGRSMESLIPLRTMQRATREALLAHGDRVESEVGLALDGYTRRATRI